ncbi:helix-turn-helix transcriptional regulator [Paenibacillus gallinarum]|uniref:Helix-turn-helix transcriptional regulator n=1 Tax=Paenibacillus gallinarum TaxID=2762232 RepID=A0ABR8SWB2_9BACL|nr:helix-turn-helix transcriptional regulator [Paenibacillus gallinarum]
MKISRGRCNLNKLIQAKGLTQAEYARRVGRSKQMISYFCNGQRVMQPEDIYSAQLLLDCTIEELYEFKLD